MITHILKAEMQHLSPAIIDKILLYADKTNKLGRKEHFFCIYFKNNLNENLKQKYLDIFNKYHFENFKFISNKINILWFILNLSSKKSKLLLHNSLSPFYMQLIVYFLLLIRRGMLKRTSLICWGEGDFNFREYPKYISVPIEYILSKVFKNMEHCILLSSEDLSLYRKIYPRSKNGIFLNYIYNKNKIKKVKINSSPTRIMVSHSGWEHNNHIKSFKLLNKFTNNDILIICPLAYGNKKYIDKVINEGKNIFGEKFTYFTELKTREEYNNLIQSLDIYITASSLQSGLYALTTSIVSGVSVFISGNLLNSFKQYNFNINNIENISSMSYTEFTNSLTQEQHEDNCNIYFSQYANSDAKQQKWKSIYS